MPRSELQVNEMARLDALRSYGILDSMCEENLDSLTRLAARLTESPTALISLVDADRQWFKSRVGLDSSETPRDLAFCAHAILTPDEPTVVADALLDARFVDNPMVTGPLGLRSYTGVPLVNPEGHALGTLCVLDFKPRVLATDALDTLKVLAQAVMTTLELRRTMRRLHEMALSDPLTDLPNRAAFMSALGQALARQRRDGRKFSLLYLDLDGFKLVNDQLGHVVGDRVLVAIARLLQGSIRQEDSVARLGGDEFGVVLVGGDGTEANNVAERIRLSIEATMSEIGWKVTVSIGAVTFVDAPRDAGVAMSIADMYLYSAKNSGRNRVVSHDYISFKQVEQAA